MERRNWWIKISVWQSHTMGIDDVRVDWIRRCENSNIKAKIEWDLDLHDVTEHTTLKKFDNYTNQAKLSWTSFRLNVLGASLVIQWLRFHASTVGSMGLILGWETKSPYSIPWYQNGIKCTKHTESHYDLNIAFTSTFKWRLYRKSQPV